MKSWYEAFPDAVRETPDFVSGFIVGLIQLIGAIILVDKLKINNLKSGAIFGLIYSVALYLIIDLQMVSTTFIVTYRYVGLDALLCCDGCSYRVSCYLVIKKVCIKVIKD